MEKSETPILDSLLASLTFKGWTTISELSSLTGIKRKRILDVCNQNLPYLIIEKKTGKIIGTKLQTILQEQLWATNKYYYATLQNYGADQVLEVFNPNEFKNLQTVDWYGGFGDSYSVSRIKDTPENRQKLEQMDITDFSKIELDNRLWEE